MENNNINTSDYEFIIGCINKAVNNFDYIFALFLYSKESIERFGGRVCLRNQLISDNKDIFGRFNDIAVISFNEFHELYKDEYKQYDNILVFKERLEDMSYKKPTVDMLKNVLDNNKELKENLFEYNNSNHPLGNPEKNIKSKLKAIQKRRKKNKNRKTHRK